MQQILSQFKGITAKGMTRALFQQAAPDLLEGFIGERIHDKSAKDIYEFLRNGNIWDIIPEKPRSFMESYAPWELDWLTLNWVFGVINSHNRAAANAIITSPQLQESIEANIASLKQHLG